MYDEIKHYITNSFDVNVIGNMLDFVYLCPCFEENELLELCIGEIQYQNEQIVDVTIKDGDGNILNKHIISRGGEQIRNLLKEHLEYLQEQKYNITENAPLFPSKNKTKYHQRTLQRYLKVLRENLKNDSIKIDYVRHESILNYYAKLKMNTSINNQECIIETANFSWYDESTVKKLLKLTEEKEKAYYHYLLIIRDLNIPRKINNGKEVDIEKIIEEKTNFFNSVDNNKYLMKKEKENLENWYICRYSKMGVEFNTDGPITIIYTPPSVPPRISTLKEFLLNIWMSEEDIRHYSEWILVEYLRYRDNQESYIAQKLEEYLRYLGRSEDYIAQRIKDFNLEKPQTLPQTPIDLSKIGLSKSAIKKLIEEGYTPGQIYEKCREITSLPKNLDALVSPQRINIFENQILQSLKDGRIKFDEEFSLE